MFFLIKQYSQCICMIFCSCNGSQLKTIALSVTVIAMISVYSTYIKSIICLSFLHTLYTHIFIKVFHLNSRLSWYSSISVSFFINYYYYFLFAFSTTPVGIFMKILGMVHSCPEGIFLSEDVNSGPRYWRFSYFEGVIWFRDFLRINSKYFLQISRA